jgi:hypothetical protein
LTNRQSLSYSRTSQYFTEPKISLSYSKGPSTGPYPEPDKTSPYCPNISEIRLNNIHPPRSGFLYWFTCFCLSHQIQYDFYLDSCAIRVLLISSFLMCDPIIRNWPRIHVIKHLNIQCSPTSYRLILLRSKYCPPRLFLTHPRSMFLPSY